MSPSSRCAALAARTRYAGARAQVLAVEGRDLWLLEREFSSRRRTTRVAAGLLVMAAGAAVLPADDRATLLSTFTP